MNRIVEHNYGADADGNRGITQIFCELTEEDTPEIESQIIEYMQATRELPDEKFSVCLIDPVTENDVHMEINPFEYICEEECQTYLTEE